MPKSTFLNLPDDKRAKLIELALDEFAAQPYHQASLSRIVERAGIAKGSVYQYFENKLDLYRWLLGHEVPRRKLAAQRSVTASGPEDGPEDLQAWLRALVLGGIDSMLADPRLIAVVAPITQATADPELRQFYDELRNASHAAFVELLVPLRDEGQIRDDVELELVARVLGLVLGQGLPDLVLGRLGLRLEQLAAMPLRARTTHRAAITRVVDETINLLVRGFAPAPVATTKPKRRRT